MTDKTPVFNSCAHLVKADDLEMVEGFYRNALQNGIDPLQKMLDLQNHAQQSLSDTLNWVPRPNELKTCGEILDWLKLQDDAIADETRELYTALGGMSRGAKAASGVWKPWKANHQELRSQVFAEMKEEDKLEILFELIDQWHFFMCKFLALGLDAETIYKLYALKQAENLRRWANNY
ncbi:dCTPase [Cronobacter phage vB_CsaM_leE]|uniref:dCTP pyrophosphatase n=5 Tax=Pseudotevenvirus TaxID=2842979 RepID=A0A8E7KXC1_9CAUD|nr:nucleoside triphosphate pyrophosphohydrolase [Cronobacter phage vB_CsaM_leE]AOG16433.1 dCTPase [Cronobacter phage vB_CsaM_leN]QPX76378.1 putative dCTPase [Cronobacter phage vB_CsaM_SemperBestia]QTJ24199.1 dCTPase [Enterobacter phage PF-CE2]QVW27236.1 hypothetical protein AKFOPBLP_00014 [Cronobacter phage JC03]URP86051.1 dUTPase [Enterobacter phage EC-F1]UYL05670.1 hypothetical protein PMMJPKLI_00130 [Klebsiella phage KP13MC5-1]WAW44489.1 dUTPase [Klebsiella phage Kp_GWPR59]WFD55694.1 dUT